MGGDDGADPNAITSAWITLSALFINGDPFGFTLEDTVRETRSEAAGYGRTA